MTRRRQFNERKLLKVYLDDADFQRITESAKQEGISASEWVRGRCGEQVPESGAAIRRRNTQVRNRPKPQNAEASSSGVVQEIPQRFVEACPHKKARGELCYKCDPKFGLPQIDGLPGRDS